MRRFPNLLNKEFVGFTGVRIRTIALVFHHRAWVFMSIFSEFEKTNKSRRCGWCG
jgi:hypothetical protein